METAAHGLDHGRLYPENRSLMIYDHVSSNYKKKKRLEQPSDPDNLPDHDDADDEEPDDEPVVQKTVAAAPVGPKRYDYQCNCGYSFKITIPPQLIKCPDCMGKPKVVEEVKEGE